MYIYIYIIGFTLLYLKWPWCHLSPKQRWWTSVKLISLGNLLVRKVTWLVVTTTSATLILSCDFDKNCLYILSSFKNSFFSISTHTDNTLSYTATYRDNALFPFWLPETTHTLSLLHLTSSSQPHICILFATIFFLVLPLRLDLLQSRK